MEIRIRNLVMILLTLALIICTVGVLTANIYYGWEASDQDRYIYWALGIICFVAMFIKDGYDNLTGTIFCSLFWPVTMMVLGSIALLNKTRLKIIC